MKLISWNVNGIRACITKGFYDVLKESQADIFCVQETKMQEGQIELEKHGYFTYMNSAKKKGYSGTLVFSKIEPLSYCYGINIENMIKKVGSSLWNIDNFYLVNCYTPNSQKSLSVWIIECYGKMLF